MADSTSLLTRQGVKSFPGSNPGLSVLSLTTMKDLQHSPNINYQEGAVVSKEILNKPHATITLFAFDKSQGLSEHSSPYDAFVTIIDGTADIKVSGKGYTLNKGECLLMKANEPHAIKALDKFKMVLVMVKL